MQPSVIINKNNQRGKGRVLAGELDGVLGPLDELGSAPAQVHLPPLVGREDLRNRIE
jgi:hypothetical protein